MDEKYFLLWNHNKNTIMHVTKKTKKKKKLNKNYKKDNFFHQNFRNDYQKLETHNTIYVKPIFIFWNFICFEQQGLWASLLSFLSVK
jgi:hypothetical protein